MNASSQIEVEGVWLNYCLDGAGARPLVCTHGVGSYLESWSGVAAELGEDFRILRFDLRGHGRSERVKGRYEIEDFARELVALADHAGFKQFDLAGFSLGGLIAQYTALTRSDRIRRLVLLSTVAGRNRDERERVRERLAALQRGEPGAHFDASIGRWLTETFQNAHPEIIRELRRRNAENDPDCYAAAYRVLAETDLGDELGKIACPTLIATGENDQGSNPRMAQFMHERVVGSELKILPGLRHSILIEAPRLVAGMMRDFLFAPQGDMASRG